MIEFTKTAMRVHAKMRTDVVTAESQGSFEIPNGVMFSWSALQPRQVNLAVDGSTVWHFLLDLMHPGWNEPTGDVEVQRPDTKTVLIALDNGDGAAVLSFSAEDIDAFLAEVYSRPQLREAIQSDHYLPPAQRPQAANQPPKWFEEQIGRILNGARRPRS